MKRARDGMRLLVLHQNFPGQFRTLVQAWAARPGWEVRALGRDTAPGLPGFRGFARYALARKGRPGQHPYLRQIEAATLHGQAVARAMLELRSQGFVPDTILAHPGWGESLFAKDVFPNARLVHFCEWYYHAEGADLGFDPEFPLTFDDRARIRTWNALHALNLTQCDAAVTPTEWQRSRHPEIFQAKIAVQHEGIALDELRPDPAASLTLGDGRILRAGEPVVTYVARNLEPYRGFHVFMRALEAIQKAHPGCHAVVVGGDEVSYGRSPKQSANWREHMLAQVTLDPARTHFLGRIPRPRFIEVLQVSAAHVYLTYPFVLSWSLLEAMACAAPIVASDTAPVREVLRHRQNALLVPFHSAGDLAAAVLELLVEGPRFAAMRRQAAADAQRFDPAAALAAYDNLLGGY